MFSRPLSHAVRFVVIVGVALGIFYAGFVHAACFNNLCRQITGWQDDTRQVKHCYGAYCYWALRSTPTPVLEVPGAFIGSAWKKAVNPRPARSFPGPW